MAAPTPPVITNVPFDPASYWLAGSYDPATLLASLKAQAGLADFKDAAGNLQSAVRLDADQDAANVGYWVSVPRGTRRAPVDAAAAAYVPPPDPVPPRRSAALVALKTKRDRWLAQTDWITLPAGSLPTDLPAQTVSDINANLDAWKAFRQQLRDYPSTITDPLNPPPLPTQPPAPPFLLS